MLPFIGLNLRGVGETGGIEIFIFWFKLIVLLGLARWGLMNWNPGMLSQCLPDAGIEAALFGVASVFMAYEGFLLYTFTIVCGLAFFKRSRWRTVAGPGVVIALTAFLALAVRLIRTNPFSLIALCFIALITIFGHPLLLRQR